MTPRTRWHLTNELAALAIAAVMLGGCGTVPNAAALLHTNPLYLIAPRFVGPQGPLTQRQAQLVIARMQDHQETPSDILQRHLAFEQALTNVPLAIGNRAILLRNASSLATPASFFDTLRQAGRHRGHAISASVAYASVREVQLSALSR
jgi:hypothetical protein